MKPKVLSCCHCCGFGHFSCFCMSKAAYKWVNSLLSFFMTVFFFSAGGKVEWTSRCVWSMTAAAIRTAMPRTAGQKPVWTHRCHQWYAPPPPVESRCAVLGHMMWMNRFFWTEQAELIAVRPGHRRGGLRPVRWLWGVLASAETATGGGPGGAGSGPTHGPNAGGGGEANPAAQTLACGRPGQLMTKKWIKDVIFTCKGTQSENKQSQ